MLIKNFLIFYNNLNKLDNILFANIFYFYDMYIYIDLLYKYGLVLCDYNSLMHIVFDKGYFSLFSEPFLSFYKKFMLNVSLIKDFYKFFKFNNYFYYIGDPLIYKWYFNIILNFNIYNYIMGFILLFDYNKIKLLVKFLLFEANFSLYFNLNISINNWLLYKFYIKNFIQYCIDILFKVKNKITYYKSNYFYYRRIKTLNKVRKYKTRIGRSFLNVKTRRNYNSFYHLTLNTFFLKNLYNFNLNTYIYI